MQTECIKKKISKKAGRPRLIHKPATYYPKFSMSELRNNFDDLMHYDEFSLLPRLFLLLKEKGANLFLNKKEKIDICQDLKQINFKDEETNNQLNDDYEFREFLLFVMKKTSESLKLTNEIEDLLIEFINKYARNQKDDPKMNIKDLKIQRILNEQGLFRKLRCIFKKWKFVYFSLKR